MAPFVSKPETLLKQAEGLVSVGQASAALQSLTEMFSSKRFRQTPLTALEPIMLRFVGLCVDMRKGRTAKEGLMQYKNIAQNTSVSSIEVVIKHFVALADAKVQEAQEKAEKAVALVDVDDLEATETPESILLGAVSGDQNKDRTDRALVTPWLKFLWESYRTALETLKNNARLEVIYQQVAQQAFKFCLKHQRKVEFRRLCETLRLHLSNVAKYANQPHSINLADADTLQHHLDTRFAQLNTSVELELWQEAFRSVEDIHNLLTMAKKSPRPAMMANYYEKLTRIFLTSDNALFHAAAWARYNSVVRSQGGKSDEEYTRLSGQVLISALAVPVGQETEEDETKGRNARLTALLGLTKTPTRTGLLKEALSRNVLKLAPPVVKKLYDVLEVTFDPLTLCSAVAPLFRELSSNENYASYLPLLQRAVLSRLLSQLSQVYTTMKIFQLLELVTPLHGTFEGAYEPSQVEAFLMSCARNGDLHIRIDHAAGSITFIDEAFGMPAVGTSVPSGADKIIQPSANEYVRTRLSAIATTLHNALTALEPRSLETSTTTAQEQFMQLIASANAERKAMQVRRAIVARRRELLSELSARKEKEEASRRAEAIRREKDELARRTVEEIRRKEFERVKREVENIKIQEAKQLAQTLKEKNILKVDVTEMADLNTDRLMRLQVQQLEKEKREQAERLRIIAKRLDHTERAFRKEERPMLAFDYEQQQKDDLAAFEAVQQERLAAARCAHEEDIATKRRLARMLDDYHTRLEVYRGKCDEEYQRRQEIAARKVEEEKTKRNETIMKAREEEQLKQAEMERERREEEEEKCRLEEERKREEARLKEEEEKRRRAEEEEEQQKLQEQAEARRKRQEERDEVERIVKLQREREEAAERRAAERKTVTAQRTAEAPTADTWRRGGPPSRPATTATTTSAEAEAPKYRPIRRADGAPAGGRWRIRMAEKEAAAGGQHDAALHSPPASASGAATPAPSEPMSWRQKAALKEAGGAATPPRPASPAVPGVPGKDDEGFQTVPSLRRFRGRGGAGQS